MPPRCSTLTSRLRKLAPSRLIERRSGRHHHRQDVVHVDRAEADRAERDRAGERDAVGGVHLPTRPRGLDVTPRRAAVSAGQRDDGRAGVDHHVDVLSVDQRLARYWPPGVGGDRRLTIAGRRGSASARVAGRRARRRRRRRRAGTPRAPPPPGATINDGAAKATVMAAMAKIEGVFQHGRGLEPRLSQRLDGQTADKPPTSG